MNSFDWDEVLSVNYFLENCLTSEQRKKRNFFLNPYENYRNITGTDFRKSPPDFSNSVQKIDIYGLCPGELSYLEKKTNLKELYCGATNIKNISSIAKLVELEKLCLYNTQIIDISPLKELAKLRRLCLSRTSVNDLTAIGELVNLEVVSFYRTAVKDISPLAKLKKLIKVNLNYTSVNSILALTGLTNLNEVHCFGAPVPQEDINFFIATRPDCRVINNHEIPEDEYDDFA